VNSEQYAVNSMQFVRIETMTLILKT